MRKAVLACTVLLATSILGCRSMPTKAPAEKPKWVEAPTAAEDSVRFISVVGTVGPGRDKEAMLERADRLAREKLTGEVQDYTRKMATEFLQAHEDYPSPSSPLTGEFVNTLAAEVSTSILRHCMRQDAWNGPRGESYVFYRLPTSVINEQIYDKMRYTLGHINPFGADAEQATAQMRQFLARRLRERLKEATRTRVAAPETAPEYRVPAWLEAGRHDSYPEEKFLSAIGIGADAKGAEQNGRDELAARVESSLANTVRAVATPGAQSALAENIRWLGDHKPGFTEADLIATLTAEQWHDSVTGMDYAFLVLDRTTAGVIYRRKIALALKQYAALSTSARDHQNAESFAASLTDYLAALVAAHQAVQCQLRALTVAPEASGGEFGDTIAEPVVADAKKSLQSVLAQITVQKIGGDGQWTPPGVPPKEPLKVRLIAGEKVKPVAGVPVRLRLGPGKAGVLARTLTDESGMAQCQLGEPFPAEAPACTITAELDLARMAPDAGLSRLEPPSAAFSCVIRSRSNTYLVLYVWETTAGGRSLTTPLTETLKQGLVAEGFRLVEEAEILKHVKAHDLTVDSPEAELLGAFSELRTTIGPREFLFIIFGSVRTELVETVETTQGRLSIVHCHYAIKVLDADLPGDYKTVLMVSGTGTGAYAGSQSEAARRAQADAAAGAAARLLGGLSEKFGPERSGQ